MNKFFSSIRFKTVGLQIAGAMLITISLAAATYLINRQFIIRSHLEHSHIIVQAASDELEEFLLDSHVMMERITGSREFEEYLKTFRVLPLQKLFSQFNKEFSTIAILNKEGDEEVMLSIRSISDAYMNHRKSAYFQRSLENPNTVIVAPPGRSRTTGDMVLMMFLTKTGYFGDEYQGTLMAELPLSLIGENIEKFSEGEKGFIVVIDRGGQIHISTSGNKSHLNRTINQEMIVMAGSPDYRTNYVRSNVLGIDSLVTVSPVKNMQWIALRIEPFNNITGPLMSLEKMVLIMLAVIMLLTVIASIILSGRLTKRIIKLSEATAVIAGGNYTQTVPVISNDELGELADSFNRMVDSLCTTTVSREELKEKNAFLQHVVDSIPYPFFVVDMNDLSISLSNDAIRKRGDFKSAACYGMAEAAGVPCLWCDGNCSLFSVKETKQPMVAEVLSHESSGPRYYQLHAFPVIDRNGNVSEIIEYSVDITDKRLVAHELETAAQKLKALNDDLQNFIHIASHDLNEPLRKIMAFGDRLKGKYYELLGESGRDYLYRMHNAAGRMQVLLNDLLAYSRVTTKARPFEPTDLSVIIKEALDVLDMKIEQTGAQIEVGELATLNADQLQLRQVMQNLIGNALKFIRKDTVPLIRIHGAFINGRIKNGDSSRDKLYELRIEDNGIGFQEAHTERIFGVFERLHARSEYEGSGIGLSICRKIIERHGGTIKAKGIPGEGAKFIITLPVTH